MTKANVNKKVSAIDAILQPFSFESKSTQTESAPKDFRLGGRTITVQRQSRSGQWESVSEVVGGVVIKASHRVRTGKTKREKARAANSPKVDTPVVQTKGKKK